MLETTGEHSRLHIVGALNLSNIGSIIVSDFESISNESIVRFVCKLRDIYLFNYNIYIILDGAGYQRSDLVRDPVFVIYIELHHLLLYSANLNLTERLWKVMNEK